jgi:hypothetical protein
MSLNQSCDDMAMASVSITVVDGTGAAVRDAKVSFTLNGGQSQDAQCVGGAAGDCRSWTAAYEQAGTFVVTATSADGSKTDRKEAVVTSGSCHVNGVSMTLTLK